MGLVTVLRHGRTSANARGLLQGRVDNPLDDVGHAQARAASHALGPVDRVISSPLRRAVETAGYFEGDPQIDDRWIELDYGDWDGIAMGDVPRETWQAWRDDLDLRPPGGETLNELGERVRAALEELAAVDDGGHTLIVSHVSPIKAAVAWALGVSDEVGWRTFVSPASITRIGVGERGPVLQSFNERCEPG